MKKIEIVKLPITRLFIDAVEELIYSGGMRRPHQDSPGYQRDPYRRIGWIEKRIARGGFDPHLMRPIEGSPRPDNAVAVVDGGGRLLMAELSGQKEVVVRLHHGLSRQEEAELFERLDTEVYKLRSIEKFMAMLAAGEPIAVDINEAVAPYHIADRGLGSLRCVGPLMELYLADEGDTTLISRTAMILANTWSGYQGTNKWLPTKKIEGKLFLAVAILIDAAGRSFDEGQLRKVLSRVGPKDVERTIFDEHGGKVVGTAIYASAAARVLMRRYNSHFRAPIKSSDIDNSHILEALLDPKTFGKKIREAKRRPKLKAVKSTTR
jgi:hypothetical protein